ACFCGERAYVCIFACRRKCRRKPLVINGLAKLSLISPDFPTLAEPRDRPGAGEAPPGLAIRSLGRIATRRGLQSPPDKIPHILWTDTGKTCEENRETTPPSSSSLDVTSPEQRTWQDKRRSPTGSGR